MNEREHESFEADLRRLKPAPLPDNFESRLRPPPQLLTQKVPSRPRFHVMRFDGSSWRRAFRWLAPAAALVTVLLLVLTPLKRGSHSPSTTATAALAPALKADQVEIDRQLLGSFDAVANMPDGEPVRFRFQQWMDAVTLRDSARGVEVIQRIPRVEVVPVSFAIY